MNAPYTILLVDDSEPVRECMKGLLAELGYSVIDAPEGETALELYKKHQNEIALVVSDLMMPKMTGIELFDALKQVDPNVKFLLYSAFPQIPRLEKLKERGLLGFFRKPFSLEALQEQIGGALKSS